MKYLFYSIVIIVGLMLLTIAGLFVFLMVTEFKPSSKAPLPIAGRGNSLDPVKREFAILTWNIGYAGLGAGMDYFYDGGKRARTNFDTTMMNLRACAGFLAANDSIDIINIQEIDRYAKRSWFIDEYQYIAERLPGFSQIFAVNYDCRYIPMPPNDPIGRVVAGLASFSKIKPDEATVQYYDAYFKWPLRLVFLKRCFITLRYKLPDGKELIMINTHNSAFDSSGNLRKRELFILDSVMQGEFRKGNYVIAGGDWNTNPYGFDPSKVTTGDVVVKDAHGITDEFVPGWQFAFDPASPSERYLDRKYSKGVTRTTVLDFFVVSPNVEVLMVRTIPLEFQHSDHDPVIMKIRLKD